VHPHRSPDDPRSELLIPEFFHRISQGTHPKCGLHEQKTFTTPKNNVINTVRVQC
jgi:hypothetical protein